MIGQSVLAHRGGLVLSPRVGEFETERADIGPVEGRQDHLHRHVVIVRPFPVAPADVQPDPVARKAVQGAIQSRHVLLDQLRELGVRGVLVEQDTLHREIGRVDLQDKSASTTLRYSICISRAIASR